MTNAREVMMLKLLRHSVHILVAAAMLPATGWGQQAAADTGWSQQATIGPTLTQVVTGGDGVARECVQRHYGTGLGARLSLPVLTKWTTLQVAGRGYFMDLGYACVDGFPPPDGTYIQDDRVNLLSRSFVTTDVRLAAQPGDVPMKLAIGGGNAWHSGYNLPYLVTAAELLILERPDLNLGLQVEYQWLRVSSDRFRRTFQDFALVSEEPLGRVHQWSHALILGINLDVAL